MMQDENLPYVTGVSHSFIKVRGIQLHIAEAGQGKPLLLLHGWPQHWYVWRKLIPLLKNNFRLIMPDMRGFGWSEIPHNSNYTKEQLATDVLALLDILSLKQVGLIAHDWGGFVGFLACLREPKRFEAYLALGILPPFQAFDNRILQFWRGSYQIPLATPRLGTYILQNFPQFLEQSMVSASKQPHTWTREELHIFSSILQQPKRAYASSLLYRTFLMKEFLPIMRGKYKTQTLTVPTKLLVGKNDPFITKAHVKGSDNYAKNMTVDFIDNCGHFIPEEMPDLVAKEIKDLFAITDH
jgi:pimeloyl-ACP methyl ester carboxylesterase